MKNDYFKLFASCIPVRGAARAVLCDLQRRSFQPIPDTLVDVLDALKANSISSVRDKLTEDADKQVLEEYLSFLAEHEYGFFCDQEALIRFIDLPAATVEPDNTQPEITNAIIEMDAQSTFNINTVLAELESLGCRHLQLRNYGGINFFNHATSILQALEKTRFLSVDFLHAYEDDLDETRLLSLIRKYPRIQEIIFHTAPFNKALNDPMKMGMVLFVAEAIDSHQHCGVVSTYYFTVSHKSFAMAKTMNSCLAGKISVDARGHIRNCPSMEEDFGNVATTSLREALFDKKFTAVWAIHKDQVATCRDCEFRYICADCRAFISNPQDRYSKPLKCNYDPYTAEWKN